MYLAQWWVLFNSWNLVTTCQSGPIFVRLSTEFGTPRGIGQGTGWASWSGKHVDINGMSRSSTSAVLPRSRRGSSPSQGYSRSTNAIIYYSGPFTMSVCGITAVSALNGWGGPLFRRRPESRPPVDSWGFPAYWCLHSGPIWRWVTYPGSGWVPSIGLVGGWGWNGWRYALMRGVQCVPKTISQLITFCPCNHVDSMYQPFGLYFNNSSKPPFTCCLWWDLPQHTKCRIPDGSLVYRVWDILLCRDRDVVVPHLGRPDCMWDP